MSNTLQLPCDVGKVSDGYHTFDELYNHRCVLFVNVALAHRDVAFKTRRNNKGEEWGGWFILGLNTSAGQITYHLPNELWPLVESIPEIERNIGYDGHTSEDVIVRLIALAAGATR